MDSKGQVKLRRKEGIKQSAGKGSAEASSRNPAAKAPANLPAWMQQLMKNAPPKPQSAKVDADKAAALAKLDKSFEGKA
jgi:palmitoyltransferase